MEKLFIVFALVVFLGGFIYLRTHKVKKGNNVGGGGSSDSKPANNEQQTT